MQTLTIKTPKTPHKKRENSEKKREFSQIPSTKNDTHTTQGKLPSLKIQKKKKNANSHHSLLSSQPSFTTAFLLPQPSYLPFWGLSFALNTKILSLYSGLSYINENPGSCLMCLATFTATGERVVVVHSWVLKREKMQIS